MIDLYESSRMGHCSPLFFSRLLRPLSRMTVSPVPTQRGQGWTERIRHNILPTNIIINILLFSRLDGCWAMRKGLGAGDPGPFSRCVVLAHAAEQETAICVRIHVRNIMASQKRDGPSKRTGRLRKRRERGEARKRNGVQRCSERVRENRAPITRTPTIRNTS